MIGINAYVGVRLLDAPEPDLQKVRATLADICAVTERAGEVIGGLRAMLKRDGAAADLTNVDVNSEIRIVERIVHGDANLHRVTVHLDLSSGVRPVKGDSVQLQQVVLNLMLNAFSAMSGTELDGARRLVVRTHAIDDSHVLIEVQDNGTGITVDKLESIFDPFVTSKAEGLGMGLSICRSIVERHGGTISAANNPDRGATFSIVLPVSPSERRLVEHDLVVPPEPLEQGPADLARLVASDLTDAAFSVDGIDQAFLPRIDRQVDIRVCVCPVDQDRRGTRRQPLLKAERVRHSNRHVVEPPITGETRRPGWARAIVAADNDAVAHHRPPEQFGSGMLLCRFERCDSRRLREPGHHPAMRTVRRLPDPAAERQPCTADEFQKLRH